MIKKDKAISYVNYGAIATENDGVMTLGRKQERLL